MSPNEIAIAIAAVVIVVGAIIYLRKHPEAKAKLDAEFTSIEGKVSETADNAWHSLIALVSKQHDTIAAQATVIASPPVQAAINATPVHIVLDQTTSSVGTDALPVTKPVPVTAEPAPGATMKDGYPYVSFGGQMVYQYDGRNFLTTDAIDRYKVAVAARAEQQAIIDTFAHFGPDPAP